VLAEILEKEIGEEFKGLTQVKIECNSKHFISLSRTGANVDQLSARSNKHYRTQKERDIMSVQLL